MYIKSWHPGNFLPVGGVKNRRKKSLPKPTKKSNENGAETAETADAIFCLPIGINFFFPCMLYHVNM